MRKTIYICGPITGLPANNIHAFRDAQRELEKRGYRCIVPHDLFEGVDTQHYEHHDYMRPCLQAMMTADAVFVIGEWMESKGATMEVNIARQTEFLPVYFPQNIERMEQELRESVPV